MIRRAWILPFHNDETPGGYCSRLAAWNGCADVSDFCSDMSLSYSDIVNGNDAALQTLGSLTGVDVAAFRRNSFIKVAPRIFAVRDDAEISAHSRRNYIRVCPRCLADDIATNPSQGIAAPFQRVHWQLSWARSCPIHGLSLMVIAEGRTAAQLDFSRSIEPLMAGLAIDSIETVALPSTGLERYLLGRIYAGSASKVDILWLNELPIYKAVRLCEVLGAVSLFGVDVSIKGMDEATVAAAGAAGYEILLTGPQALREMLSKLVAVFWNMEGRVAGGKLFGLLYEWLQDTMADSDYDPVRNFIRSIMQDGLPVESFVPVFGRPIEERKVWSILTAAQEFNVKVETLRKYLVMKGVIDRRYKSIPNEKVVFDVESIAPILEPLRGILSSKDAAAHLGIPLTSFRRLAKSGHISPYVPDDNGSTCDSLFSKSTLEDFFNRLFSFVTMEEAQIGMLDIYTAASSTSADLETVFELLLDGKLVRVARNVLSNGCASIIVDPEEIEQIMQHNKKKTSFMIKEAAKYKKWSSITINSLTLRGILPYVNSTCKSGQKCLSIHIDDLDRFDGKYISFERACKEYGYRNVCNIISSDDLKVAIESVYGSARFYLRSDLSRLIKSK